PAQRGIGLYRVRRAIRTGAGAALGHVADFAGGSGTTDSRRRLERISRTVVGAAVAELGHVAHAGSGAALGRALGIRRAVDARARAVLRRIADAARCTTQRRTGLHGVGRAIVADAIAGLGHVAEARRRAAFRRALGVSRAGLVGTVAVLERVADSRRSAAQCGVRLHRVR